MTGCHRGYELEDRDGVMFIADTEKEGERNGG